MNLQEAIKQLVSQFGESIISEIRLANLLADLNAYEEYPAMKPVFKEILKTGFGKKLYDAFKVNPANIQNVSDSLMKQMAKEYKFKADLMSYGFDCLLFGIGCIDSVKEPLSNGYDPFSKGDQDFLNNLPGLLDSLQKEYLDLLDSLITLPKDILRDAPGYYSTEALTKLYAIEAKIAAVQQESMSNSKLLLKYNGWCEQKRAEKLAFYKKKKDEAVELDKKRKIAIAKETLDNYQQQYLKLLSSSIIIPKKFGIKKSGYYNETTLKELSQIESGIKIAYDNQSKQYDDWCEKELAKALAKYKVDSSNIAKQFALKIGVSTAAFIGIAGTGTSYITSASDIRQFDQTILQGEQSASSGNYGKALQLFDNAKNNYHGSFRSGHYEDIANEHITSSIDAAAASINTIIGQGKLTKASSILSSLPMKVVVEDENNAGKINEAKENLTKAIGEGLNNLISNISQNNGHLDTKGKEQLKELLSINPNDYWLNFIKNKEQ